MGSFLEPLPLSNTMLNVKGDRSYLRMLQPPLGAQLDWLLDRLL